MVEVISEKTQAIDGSFCVTTQELSDGSVREISQHGDKIYSVKTTQSDGSYIEVNGNNIKTKELTSDGYLREYDPKSQKLKKETSPDKVVKTFHDNGNIDTLTDEQNGKYYSFYENGNEASYEDKKKNYQIYKDVNGNINYELKDRKLTINPAWFSYYRLGVKSQNNQDHWEEKVTLNPKKKTLLCLGGDQTKDARKANGNINGFVSVMGLSLEDISKMQLVSCYRPFSRRLNFIWCKIGGLKKQLESDYKREILQKFMPFMARQIDGKFEPLSPKELANNFSNIMIQAHCYGANDLPYINNVFKEAMTKLGYEKQVQQHALKQIICVTNNTQRELTDNLDFSCIHRYSVKDGQFEPEYNTDESDHYPVFVQDYPAFADKKGNKAAFIETKPNEMFMVFDKILRQGNEHNEAFWTVDKESLTAVGKNQAHLMARIGRFWYHNHEDVSNVCDLIQKAIENSTLEEFVDKALVFGKELKLEKNNILSNHHILKSAWNKFKNPQSEIPKTGVYKLLSDKYKE